MNRGPPTIGRQGRTLLLHGAATGLLVAIGDIGGGAWFYVLLALALAIDALGYWFSGRLAVAATDAEWIPPGRVPALDRIVESLAGRAGIPRPQIYAIPSLTPNAFATGRDRRHAIVAVTVGLIAVLPPGQLEAVIAHEFAHIKNRDTLVAALTALLGGALAAIGSVLLLGVGDDLATVHGLLKASIALLLAPAIAMVIVASVIRRREYLADATAARLLADPRSLSRALRRLDLLQHSGEDEQREHAATLTAAGNPF